MFPRGFGKSEYTGCAASHISIHDGFKAQSDRSQTDSFVMQWVHCACNSTEKWNIWVFERGGEVPSCITDVCTLHECHAASLSCFSSLPRINSLLLANQINTPQQSLRRFHFSMK